ncbi:MAG: YihY/virulence factor BrkB family protein [candidate division Zixibacteria bacterium]|nr:YihY/virulence factor BrkB family protein [candidate division Zixibacteria bacterium]
MTEKNKSNHKALDFLGYLKSFFSHYLGGLYNRLDEHHVFLLSGGLSFSIFVCIVPFILIIFAILGNILEQPSIAVEIQSFIERIIPYEDYAASIEELVFSRVDEFKVYKNIAGLIGMIGLLFAASGLFSSMRTILNKVYHVQTTQHMLIGKLRDLGLVFLVLCYFLLSTTILPTFEVVFGFADRFEFLHGLRFSFIEDIAVGSVSFFIIFAAFFTMYYLVPQKKMSKRVTLVSALSAALLWEIARQLFGFYITNFVTLKRIYGAYVFLIVVAFWIYYTSIVFIIGAEIGQLFRERMRKRKLSLDHLK